MAPKKGPPPNPEDNWATSTAKKLLKEDILSGRVTYSMKASVVKPMRPEYAKWIMKNFRTNLNTLRDGIARDQRRMLVDCEAYGHDLAIVKEKRQTEIKTPFYRTPAKPLLKQDVYNGAHLALVQGKKITPKQLYKSRPEYQAAATMEEFRGYLYQEIKKKSKIETKVRIGKKKLSGKRGGEAKDHLVKLVKDYEDTMEKAAEQLRRETWKK